MKAIFIGQDRSMGLAYGNLYDIEIRNMKPAALLEVIWSDNGYNHRCTYDRFEGILRNWQLLQWEILK